MRFGINLANGPNPVTRIAALGAGSYLALHPQLPDLIALKKLSPHAGAVVRYYARNLLSTPQDQVLASLTPTLTLMAQEGIKDLVVGNELNNPVEGAVLSPVATAQYLQKLYQALKVRCPWLTLHLPAFSPGFSGWQRYLSTCWLLEVPCEVVDVHAYGTLDQMKEVVGEALGTYRKSICITETNFGAGQRVNLTDYLPTIKDFLTWCNDQVSLYGPPHWFAWKWVNPDFSLPTSVDIEGSVLEPYFTKLSAGAPMTLGMDVYSGTGTVDFVKAKAAGYALALIKRTQGTGYVSPVGADQVSAARAAGAVIVHYHYGDPSKSSGHDEASAFLAALKASGGILAGEGAAIDIEDTGVASQADLLAYLLDFLKTLEGALGFKPMIYSGYWYMQPHNLLNHPELADYPLWYASVQPQEPSAPAGWKAITVWQYNWNGQVPGVQGPVDLDQSDLSLGQLRALGAPAPWPAPPPTYNIGAGFSAYLEAHPEYGQPQSDAWSDAWGDTFLWTTGSPAKPQGGLLVWRQRLNQVRCLDWN